MTDLQLDIFGNEVPMEQVEAAKPKETVKTRWRKMYGYDQAHKCGDCRFICKYTATDYATYYKCNLMGISATEATDIQQNDPACKRWERAR